MIGGVSFLNLHPARLATLRSGAGLCGGATTHIVQRWVPAQACATLHENFCQNRLIRHANYHQECL